MAPIYCDFATHFSKKPKMEKTKGTLNASLLHFRTGLYGQRQPARIQSRHSIDFNDSAIEIRSILPSMSRLTTSVKASTVSTLYR